MGVWCLLVPAKPVREANTSRVKPDRLAWGRDQRRRRAASGDKHRQTHVIKQSRAPDNIRTPYKHTYEFIQLTNVCACPLEVAVKHLLG